MKLRLSTIKLVKSYIKKEKTRLTIIMGDFNIIVGEGCKQKIVGVYRLGRRNNRERMFTTFYKQHDLVETNT